MKKLWLMLAMMVCVLASCSDGGSEEPIIPSQKPEEVNPEVTIDSSVVSSGLSFNAAKGESTLSFTTNADWSLSIAETRSGTTWCTASPTSGSKGTANVKFTTTENTEYEDRSVAVTIKAGTASKTFNITQKAADALLVTTTKYEVPKEGGQIEIEVKLNIDYQMVISEAAKEWIAESKSKSRALKTHKHVLDIAANEDANKREGEITFKSGNKVETVKVYQAGEAVLLLSQSEFIVSDAGETISVDIKSNVEYDVQMPDVDWITDESSNRGLSSHTMKFAVAANETYDSRSAEIIFSDKNSSLQNILKITQIQNGAIVVSKKEYDVNPEGETIEIELNSNVDFDISVEHDWIAQVESKSSRGLVSHKLYFRVAENDTKEERSSKIYFTDKNKQITEAVVVKQKIKEEKDIPYLTFSAEGKQTLTMTKAVETLEYSVNGGEWKELGTNVVEFGGDKGNLRLRGSNPRGTSDFNNYSTIIFGTNVLVTSSGDIKSLVDYKNIDTVNTEQARFCNLFQNCNVLTTAPKLSATTLNYFCYKEMFKGCTNLVNAPQLPARTLKGYCYESMFEGCTNLVNAPELSATTLDDYCCFNMFSNCTSLVNAPKLPATILADYCYFNMFSNCTSLVNAPKLPATILADYCYFYMFSNCTSLVDIPELPATALARFCYAYMFYGCTSLVNAPQLPATTLKESCYSAMFYGCINLVDAPKQLGIQIADYCCMSMFGGCTSLVNAPQLPATTLKTNCYTYMFNGCTSLVNAPDLPADNLANNCYKGMFEGCTSLIKAPELPAKKLVNECYFGMFENCANLKEAPQLPALVLADKCYAGMFKKCTSLTTPPQLPATTLAKSCYDGMFYGCTNLTKAPDLPATTLKEFCYAGMFEGCINLTMAPDLPATILKDYCYAYMFYGCKNLKEAPRLPALNLAVGCYQEMFCNCTSLITAPALPALQLTNSCYVNMFYGCTSLTTAPVLPASQLSENNYGWMFYGCTSLNNITFLATEISDGIFMNLWMKGVSSTGTFIKSPKMDITILRRIGAIPNGWTIKDLEDEDRSSANGNMENPNESNSSEW